MAGNKQKRYDVKLSDVKMEKVGQSVRFAIVHQNQHLGVGLRRKRT